MRPHSFLARRELPHHPQSHWIAVCRRFLTNPVFREYWGRVPPVPPYCDSIQWHESRFTGHFAELGHTWQVTLPVGRYRSEDPAIEEVPALLVDGRPLLKRRALFYDPFHRDHRAVVGRELLEAATQVGHSEDLILSDIVHTIVTRDLTINASLTEIVTGHVPGAAGAGVETGSPKWRPTNCVVVHIPTRREALKRARVDGLAQHPASLPAHW